MNFWRAAILALTTSVWAQEQDAVAEPDPYYFNGRPVPENMEDLHAIEDALQKGREKVKEAVVCIEANGGFGSGVIISADGLILTAAHVTSGVDKDIVIVLPDGKKVKAKSLGLRADNDAAMAKITEGGPYPFVEVQKEVPKLGEWVFSLGHSGGFDKERGMVTRLGRIIGKQEHTLSSDCSLIGGDSGGPLFNMKGELVGIHSRVDRSTELNMHVSIPMFTQKWDQMLAKEFVGKGPYASQNLGFLGIAVEESKEGIRVTRVAEPSAAKDGGIQVGDLLLQIKDKPMSNLDSFEKAFDELYEDNEVEIKIKRASEEKTLKVKLRSRFEP